jgi:hypothetical protein
MHLQEDILHENRYGKVRKGRYKAKICEADLETTVVFLII